MAVAISVRFPEKHSPSVQQLLIHLQNIRNIQFTESSIESDPQISGKGLLEQLTSINDVLRAQGHTREAETLSHVSDLSLLSSDFGGLGYPSDTELSSKQEAEVVFLASAWLEALNSADRVKSPPKTLSSRPEGRRGMTLSEKIFAAHDIDHKGHVRPGDVVRVGVDWIMASELSWNAMERAYDSLGKPGIFRNDRFWLAGDHVVDPRINENPKVKALIAASERAKAEFRMTEYQGMNYTIMHTEFCRERAQPGMLIIGSDSHTCSAGSMGALAIGLGVADVTMPLITGETWFKVPESVNIRFINAPSPGIGGKDTILYIMKELKRNTVAADRVVEFTGPGLAHLSCDARFAIANMTTEFGGISGVFVPDEVTDKFMQRRKGPRHTSSAHYYHPDNDAQYIETHVIDLAKVESFVARYPSPDDVVPISELEGITLDGCFIGACTTAEEDLIIGALILEAGMKKGLVPVSHGKRKIVPGSLPILNRLTSLGLAATYEKAGFEIGLPGCSYCIGMGADRAGPGEVWISSQNRNFENRMGTGSIGHLGSAATVAASSFNMTITDPQLLLDEISQTRLKDMLNYRSPNSSLKQAPRSSRKPISYVEPGFADVPTESGLKEHAILNTLQDTEVENIKERAKTGVAPPAPVAHAVIDGKIQVLGDFVDTDALAPAESLTGCITDEEFGEYCLKHTHPEFRNRAKAGSNVVVAGAAFGCGSSRENAVSALKGCGIVCVIAKSFAFIYGRNQPNLGLLGITITDEDFYSKALDGADIRIDLKQRKVVVGTKEWSFNLSAMELKLIETGGINTAFTKFGRRVFEIMCAPVQTNEKSPLLVDSSCGTLQEVQW